MSARDTSARGRVIPGHVILSAYSRWELFSFIRDHESFGRKLSEVLLLSSVCLSSEDNNHKLIIIPIFFLRYELCSCLIVNILVLCKFLNFVLKDEIFSILIAKIL